MPYSIKLSVVYWNVLKCSELIRKKNFFFCFPVVQILVGLIKKKNAFL